MISDTIVGKSRNEELVKKGLERSCESLGFFLKEKAELEGLTFRDPAPEITRLSMEIGNKEIILFSEIIGEVSGYCFFLLDQKEAELLFRKNFTAQSSTAQKQIFDAFLLEMDNIITASVVTEFANFLKVKIYGGVPNIIYHTEEEGIEKIAEIVRKGLFTINFKCRYKIQGVEFSPVFYWVLDSKFVEMINQHSA